MDFAFSADQELLRAAARDYLADRMPNDRMVSLAESEAGTDPADWKAIAELGWLDPELGLLEHAVLAEETGYTLLSAPWWSTVALTWPLLDDDLRGAIAAGERSATLAYAESGGPATISDAAARSSVKASGDSLTGTKVNVPDLTSVSDVIVVATDGLYVVDVA